MDSRAHDEALRDIVRSVEQNTDLDPDHPDLLELKRILLEKASSEVDETKPSGLAASPDAAALPIASAVGQALGLGATAETPGPPIEIDDSQPSGLGVPGDPPPLPIDSAVSQALGLGTPADIPSPSVELADSQASSPGEAGKPPPSLPD